MGEYGLWLGGQTHKHTERHTHRHINTMIWRGLGAGPSENPEELKLRVVLVICCKYILSYLYFN